MKLIQILMIEGTNVDNKELKTMHLFPENLDNFAGSAIVQNLTCEAGRQFAS